MAQARLRALRLQALGMAWLSQGVSSPNRIQEYIRCGEIGDTSRDDVEPYDADIVKSIVTGGRL